MSKTTPSIASILVHYNSADECINIVNALIQLRGLKHHVVVVDNESEQYTVLEKHLKTLNCELIRNTHNGGYGSGMNLGVKYAQQYSPEYIQIINTDISILNPNYIDDIISLMDKDPSIGLIGPGVLYKNHSIQNTILPQVSLKSALFFKKAIKQISILESTPKLYPCEVINGVCMLIRNSAFQGIGGFDEDFFMYGEENDLCYRMQQANYNIRFWSGNSIMHFEEHNRKTSKEITWRDLLVRSNQVLFLQKHQTKLISFFVSFVFTVILSLKVIIGHKLKGFTYAQAFQYMFKPILLNRRMAKRF